MESIPTISEQEAQCLVDSGVDDPGFFSMGDMPWIAEIPISKERYDQLIEEAKRFANILQSGEISYLKAARGADLRLLHERGIYFVRQLLTEECPSDFGRALWEELSAEASCFVSR
jgi:hypothetical protein